MAKKKRSLTSIGLIQTQYRRRIWRGIHIGIFMASQTAIWLWWMAEAIRTGQGFHANFFFDRIIVLVVWTMLLLTHIWVTRLLNERDRQIADMLESDGFSRDESAAVEPNRVVFARRLEDNFADDEGDTLTDEEPSRNSNHR